MAFFTNSTHQMTMNDSFTKQSPRVQKFIENSWAKGFADIIFPRINEERFSVLYSANGASRPNTPVNIIISALILKEMFSLTDEELFASILCDVRFQYALCTTSYEEQPFSDRTLSRFRERLNQFAESTGRDLMHEEMEALAASFVQYLKMNTNVKRMDSLMVASNCKKMSRLEILYTCVANLAKMIHRTGESHLLKGLENYLEEDDRNRTIYRTRDTEITDKLQRVIDDAEKIIKELGEAYYEMPEYQQVSRAIHEQTEISSTGHRVPKENKSIRPNSLQNPSDPDATYRKKAGKNHIGFVANIVETVDENGIIITDYDYQTNQYSDSKFCEDFIEKIGQQEEPTILSVDGAYANTKTIEMAAENNIELVATTLAGKTPDEIHGLFQLDEESNEITACPMGKKPYKTRYYEQNESYRVSFNHKVCQDCPLQTRCGIKIGKRSAYVLITRKKIERARYFEKLSTEAYRVIHNLRNGVEGIPSVLRRRYGVDKMPTRGLVRSKIWFSTKIGAINVKRVLKRVKEIGILCFSRQMKNTNQYFNTIFEVCLSNAA